MPHGPPLTAGSAWYARIFPCRHHLIPAPAGGLAGRRDRRSDRTGSDRTGGDRTGGDRLAWLEEGAHLVVPGIHRIPLPLPFDGLRAVNAYAIESADGLTMIDSGWMLDATKDQLERSLARIGAGFGDIRRFLVTHIHRDHYTQAIGLRRIFGMTVALGADEKHSLDRLLGKDALRDVAAGRAPDQGRGPAADGEDGAGRDAAADR